MKSIKETLSAAKDKDIYSDQEINELAEWLGDLTLRQTFFLKESYEAMLEFQANDFGGNGYIH